MTDFSRATKTLYYPFFSPSSDNWVKHALLYWEGVRCLVPERGYLTRKDASTPDLHRELLDQGLLEEIPTQKFSATASKIAEPVVKQLMLESRFDRHDPRAIDSLKAPSTEYGIHPRKITRKFLDLLVDAGMAREVEGMISVGEGLFWVQMTALASTVSHSLGIPMSTDVPMFEIPGHCFGAMHEGVRGRSRPIPADGFSVARLVVPVPIAEDLTAVSLKRILVIRKKYASERRRFRDEIQGLAASLQNAQSDEHVSDIIDDAKSRVSEAAQDRAKSIAHARAGLAASFISLSFPAMISGLALPPGAMFAAQGFSMLLSLTGLRAQFCEYRRSLSASPWSYVTTLEKKLTSRSYMRKLLAAGESFNFSFKR